MKAKFWELAGSKMGSLMGIAEKKPEEEDADTVSLCVCLSEKFSI